MRAPRALPTVLAAAWLLASGGGPAAGDASRGEEQRFAVTVTNLTRGQRITPILVSTHAASFRIFDLGQPAGPELIRVAEEGDTAPLAALLGDDPGVLDVQVGSGLLDPGRSMTITVRTRSSRDRVSAVAMLIPTNDGFFALSGVRGPQDGAPLVFYSPAYDAGSEANDELCASIPGPDFEECGGPGGGAAPSGGEEGFVHIHAGIHGIGDIDPSRRDWRNPVVRITIRRLPLAARNEQVAQDILALTKLNYNACRVGDSEPVTVGFSNKVGEILVSNPTTKSPRPNFKFYI